AYTGAVLITWDPDKAAANIDKHGVDFQDAAAVLTDPLSATFPSEDHSESEARFLTIGESAKGPISSLCLLAGRAARLCRILSGGPTICFWELNFLFRKIAGSAYIDRDLSLAPSSSRML